MTGIPVFDAFAFLATLRETTEAPAPPTSPVRFCDFSSHSPEPCGQEPAPHNGFRNFRGISPSSTPDLLMAGRVSSARHLPPAWPDTALTPWLGVVFLL